MKASIHTKGLAAAALLASSGPIAFAAQLGIAPDMDLAPAFPVWAGYSAVFAILLFGLTFIGAGADILLRERAQ